MSDYKIIIVPMDGKDSKTISLGSFKFFLIKLFLIVIAILAFLIPFIWGDYIYLQKNSLELSKKLKEFKQKEEYYNSINKKITVIDRYIQYLHNAMNMVGKEVPPSLSEFTKNDSLQQIYRFKSLNKDENRPNILPVTEGWVSRKFSSAHKGVDYVAPIGTIIRATASGIVTKIENDENLGKMVTINHNNGYVTKYAHCDQIIVKKGDIVEKGETIATVGNSGKTTSGPHLHYVILKNNTPIDPQHIILKGF